MTGALRAVPQAVSAGLGTVLGAAAGAVARARGARALHPDGIVVAGRLVRHGVPGSGVAWLEETGDDDVVVRLSRGGGLPAWAPDVHGLALRHDGTDLLLSTTSGHRVLRHVPTLRRSPGRGGYGSVMPFRGPSGPVLLAAVPSPRRALPADLAALAVVLEHEPLRLRMVWATPTGPWRTFGRLDVGGPRPVDRPLRFDPLRSPPGLDVYAWTRLLREPAYTASRDQFPDGARPFEGSLATTTTRSTA